MSSEAFEQNLLTAVREIAHWHVSRGQGDLRPWAAVQLSEVPTHLIHHWTFLHRLTFADLVQAWPNTMDPLSVMVDHLTSGLSPRDLTLLAERILPDRPTTLQSLGLRWGVSHQRVAQMERALRNRLQANLRPGTALGDLIARIVFDVQALAPLTDVLAMFPTLARPITTPGTEVWRIVAKLVDGIEIADGWLAIPSITESVRGTQRALEEFAVWPGVYAVEMDPTLWAFSEGSFDEWVKLCGLVRFRQFIVRPNTTTAGALAQVMTMATAPQTIPDLEQLLALIDVRRARHTIEATLRSDDRFERLDRDHWTTVMQGPTFADFLKRLETLVDLSTDVTLEDARELGKPDGIDAAAVDIYANVGRLMTVDGVVRRNPMPSLPAFHPTEAPGVYWVDGCWSELLTLTAPDVSTARVQVGTAIGVAFGLRPGTRAAVNSLPSADISWLLPSVLVSLPKATMNRYSVGDRIFVQVSPGSLQVRAAEPVRQGQTGYAAVLGLFGLPASGEPGQDAASVAAALGLPASSEGAAIRQACWRKREWAALDVLRELADGPEA